MKYNFLFLSLIPQKTKNIFIKLFLKHIFGKVFESSSRFAISSDHVVYLRAGGVLRRGGADLRLSAYQLLQHGPPASKGCKFRRQLAIISRNNSPLQPNLIKIEIHISDILVIGQCIHSACRPGLLKLPVIFQTTATSPLPSVYTSTYSGRSHGCESTPTSSLRTSQFGRLAFCSQQLSYREGWNNFVYSVVQWLLCNKASNNSRLWRIAEIDKSLLYKASSKVLCKCLTLCIESC